MTTRFENTGEGLSSFADVFYVRCPQCDKNAAVRKITGEIAHNYSCRNVSGPNAWVGIETYARLLCPHCGHVKDLRTNGYAYGNPMDWYFGLPLWFQMPCCGETLWAYNRPHLAYLQRYVKAELRDECSYPNSGLARYLPQWMKSAKNRDEVLRCIGKLMQA